MGFAIGSACFFVALFLGCVQLVGEGADGVMFFVGSVSSPWPPGGAARGHAAPGPAASNPSWWSAAIQFAGTLLFNLNTFNAMRDGLSTKQENRLVFAPDLFGSACFLASGLLAYRAAAGPRSGWLAANLAGCVLFGISAIASWSSRRPRSRRPRRRNWCTSLGALCFLIGALMLLPRKWTVLKRQA